MHLHRIVQYTSLNLLLQPSRVGRIPPVQWKQNMCVGVLPKMGFAPEKTSPSMGVLSWISSHPQVIKQIGRRLREARLR